MKSLSKKNLQKIETIAREVRKSVLRMVTVSKSSHIGSAFSAVDILVALYGLVLKHDHKNPDHAKRDRLLLSKGHACSAQYALLAELGYFDKDLLKEYTKDGSMLMSHINFEVPGVDFSTGSLGHALPVGVGLALAAKKKREKWKTYVLLSDGELNEGSNWEACMMASHLKLNNLIVVVDCNGLQGLSLTKDVIDMSPLDKKFRSFGWDVQKVNGHEFGDIYDALVKSTEKPKIILAKTTKGKGVSFMEHKVAWHYRSPSQEEFDKALLELEL